MRGLVALLLLLLSSSVALAVTVDLAWNPSSDNVGVTGYNVYRDGVLIGTSTGPSFTDSTPTLQAGTQYSYTVRAFDARGNLSGPSAPIIVNTLLDTYPGITNTGVPTGTVLTTYAGPCVITTPNTTIDSKTVNCSLEIQTSGVVISKSKVNGGITLNTSLANAAGWNFIVRDSEIDVGGSLTIRGIEGWNWQAYRNNIHGSYSGAYCVSNAVAQDNYFHGNALDPTGVAHMSAIRQEADCVIRHNSILCDAPVTPPDCCCSAGLTGYPDFVVIQRNTIDNNIFRASPMSSYCAFGGSTLGKPFSGQTNNIRFTNNVFEKGANGKCGDFAPVGDFNPAAPGNVWTNNRFDDATVIPPPPF